MYVYLNWLQKKKNKLTKLVANSKQIDSRAREFQIELQLPSDFKEIYLLFFFSFFVRIERSQFHG